MSPPRPTQPDQIATNAGSASNSTGQRGTGLPTFGGSGFTILLTCSDSTGSGCS
ncbi:hypothetical protein [Saccharopolyspora gregorii]|uniref:hypothetical protein n=1 Tax=Saccharopolyspora gregorii TaxID=33914 RepID=UPI0031EC222B